MDRYVDITDEIFRALQDHETDCIVLSEEIAGSFQMGDTLKLYHPSNENEALRVLIETIEKEESNAVVKLHCSLLEWVFRIETELDDLLKEEEEYLKDLFF